MTQIKVVDRRAQIRLSGSVKKRIEIRRIKRKLKRDSREVGKNLKEGTVIKEKDEKREEKDTCREQDQKQDVSC